MRETNRRAGEMLANLGVNIHPDTLVESLTIAQQQMVEIVKAVSFDGRIMSWTSRRPPFPMTR